MRKYLLCNPMKKWRMMRDLYKIMASFQQDFPNACYEDFLEAFGRPEYMAGEMIWCDRHANQHAIIFNGRIVNQGGILVIAGLLCCMAVKMPVRYTSRPLKPQDKAMVGQVISQPQVPLGVVIDMSTGQICCVCICDS